MVPEINALPPKQPGIGGPGAGSEQGQGCPDGRQEDAGPGVARPRGGVPEGIHRNHGSGYRSPQTGQKKNSSGGCDYSQGGSVDRGSGSQFRKCVHDQRRASNQAHEQEAGAGPAWGESGEEPSQDYSQLERIGLGDSGRTPKRAGGPLF